MARVRDRRRSEPIRQQLRVVIPLIPVWVCGLAIMGAVALGNRHLVDDLLLDANFTAGVHWYVGVVTYLGILSWTTAAVSAAWGAWLCSLGGRTEARRFLVASACLTTYVMADDLLQLHADLIPRVTGLAKQQVELVLMLVVVVWLGRYWRQIVRTRWAVLGLAGLALFTSIVVDALPWYGNPRLELLIEDGAKLLGNLGWATYFVSTARDIGRSVFDERSGRTVPPGPKVSAEAVLSSLSAPE